MAIVDAIADDAMPLLMLITPSRHAILMPSLFDMPSCAIIFALFSLMLSAMRYARYAIIAYDAKISRADIILRAMLCASTIIITRERAAKHLCAMRMRVICLRYAPRADAIDTLMSFPISSLLSLLYHYDAMLIVTLRHFRCHAITLRHLMITAIDADVCSD